MKWDNEMAQNEINRNASNKLTAALKRTKMQTEYRKPAAANTLTAALKRTKQQIEYEQDVIMDRETKAKSSKMSKDIVNDIVNSSVNQSETRKKAASTKLQAAAKGAIQRKQDRAVTNMANLTDQLKETVQYGNSQAVLNEYTAKRQNISNFGKLSKGASDDLKERWVESIKGEQSRRKKISNFAKLTTGLKQQQHQHRLGIASVQPMSLETGTRSGAAFTATNEQLKTRLELHKERNPELTKLRGQISDFKRGKVQLSDIQKAGIETRIQQLVEINKKLKAQGQGPKLGRPGK
jgi:hypothetical protein